MNKSTRLEDYTPELGWTTQDHLVLHALGQSLRLDGIKQVTQLNELMRWAIRATNKEGIR